MKVIYPGPAIDPAVAVTSQRSIRLDLTVQAPAGPDGLPVPLELDVADDVGRDGLASGFFAPAAEAATSTPTVAPEPTSGSGSSRRRREASEPPATPPAATE